MTTNYSSLKRMQLEKLLGAIGFSENESKVYLACLGVGTASAQKIAEQAGLPRTTVYSVLTYLVKRGIVAKTVQQDKTRFLAEAPEKLLNLLTDLKRQVEKSLPELEALYNTSQTKPKILFYEGKGSIRRMLDDTLEQRPKEILMWNSDRYFEFDRYGHDKDYIEKRVSLGIHGKRICGKGSKWALENKKRDAKELSETVVVQKKMFLQGVEINIYNEKVMFMNFAENNGLIIESRAIAETMKEVYQLSWLGAKTLENNKSNN